MNAKQSKPDCIGQKFNRLTFLKKEEKLWLLECDCGKQIKRRKYDVIKGHIKSCGCLKAELRKLKGEKQSKPDCTGQKFGKLTVLRKDQIIKNKAGKSYRLWLLECDCGKQIKRRRSDFERGHIKSCGCSKFKNSGVKPQDLTGQVFGDLTALKMIPKTKQNTRTTDKSKLWLCQCVCGNQIKKTVKQLRNKYKSGLHCGEKNLYHIPYANYPVAPIPYPKEAGEIVKKYLYLTYPQTWKTTDRNWFTNETEEERIERLLRAAWIITYRRQQGEKFTPLREKRFIRKHLRYAQTTIYQKHRLEKGGGIYYNCVGNQIGTVKTMNNLPYDQADKAKLDEKRMAKNQILAIQRIKGNKS